MVEQLELIDRKRLYVRLGFKSLRSYCNNGLKFTRRQSQSLESAVREYRMSSQHWAKGHPHWRRESLAAARVMRVAADQLQEIKD